MIIEGFVVQDKRTKRLIAYTGNSLKRYKLDYRKPKIYTTEARANLGIKRQADNYPNAELVVKRVSLEIHDE